MGMTKKEGLCALFLRSAYEGLPAVPEMQLSMCCEYGLASSPYAAQRGYRPVGVDITADTPGRWHGRTISGHCIDITRSIAEVDQAVNRRTKYPQQRNEVGVVTMGVRYNKQPHNPTAFLL